jgi:PAP2 superfamily
VINLDLGWQQATGAAAGLAVVTIAARATQKPPLARIAAATREAALVLGLFALWEYAGSFSVLPASGAIGRSEWIWRVERDVHLPSETSVQHLFLPHPLLVQFFNLYYDTLHFPVLIACMIWLFVWHRDRYPQWRTTLVAFTGLCLVVQFVPVAPPRMLPGTRLVDTAVLYHQSVYSTVAGFDPDQLSAMPSVHVGWALLVAAAIITTAASRWRWLALLYPAMTTLAVVVTANHFWLDGIVGAAILAFVFGAQALGRRLVLDHDAQRLGENRRHDRQLRRADDRAAQRVGVDDKPQRGAPQVGSLHGRLAELDAGELGAGEGAARQLRPAEIDVPEHASVEGDVGQFRAPEVDRVELAAAEHHAPQPRAEQLGSGQARADHGDVLPRALGEKGPGQPHISEPHVAKSRPGEPSIADRNPAERAVKEGGVGQPGVGELDPVEEHGVVVGRGLQVTVVQRQRCGKRQVG